MKKTHLLNPSKQWHDRLANDSENHSRYHLAQLRAGNQAIRVMRNGVPVCEKYCSWRHEDLFRD